MADTFFEHRVNMLGKIYLLTEDTLWFVGKKENTSTFYLIFLYFKMKLIIYFDWCRVFDQISSKTEIDKYIIDIDKYIIDIDKYIIDIDKYIDFIFKLPHPYQQLIRWW